MLNLISNAGHHAKQCAELNAASALIYMSATRRRYLDSVPNTVHDTTKAVWGMQT